MKLTKESTQIENQLIFTHMLHYDWVTGIIWLSKNNTKGKSIRITSKDVPITITEKDKFYYNRSGWGVISNNGKNPCSYISKEKSPDTFKYWVKFIYDKYMELKNKNYRKQEVE